MRTIVLAAALFGSIAYTSVAFALDGNSTVTGPQGQTATRSGSANCADASCTRTGSVTGPQGKTSTGARTVTRTAPGQWSAQGTATGRNGRTVSRTGNLQRSR